LTSIGAPATVLLAAFFLYLIPLWNLFLEIRQSKILSNLEDCRS